MDISGVPCTLTFRQQAYELLILAQDLEKGEEFTTTQALPRSALLALDDAGKRSLYHQVACMLRFKVQGRGQGQSSSANDSPTSRSTVHSAALVFRLTASLTMHDAPLTFAPQPHWCACTANGRPSCTPDTRVYTPMPWYDARTMRRFERSAEAEAAQTG